jgi:uncharacterized membrane protein YagU involved in acid resistance
VDARLNWRAAAWAGVAAGIVSTMVEIVLWSVHADALPQIFLRDAGFAAAIVMGPGVLSPPTAVAWKLLWVATFVHFALSLTYAMAVSLLIRPLRTLPSLLAGAAFGLVLYGVNMYGFTIAFPWFEATRGWITAAAHVAFGVAAAGTYRLVVGANHVMPDRSRS